MTKLPENLATLLTELLSDAASRTEIEVTHVHQWEVDCGQAWGSMSSDSVKNLGANLIRELESCLQGLKEDAKAGDEWASQALDTLQELVSGP